MPIKLKEVKRHIKLIERRQEQPFKIVVTFSRNGLITRQEVHSVKAFASEIRSSACASPLVLSFQRSQASE